MVRSRQFVLGLVVTVVFITIFLYRTDLEAMGTAFRTANYLYVVPGVLIYFLSLLFRTVRWRVALTPLGRFGVRRLWPVIIVGYAANNVLPVRLGELVRAYYLGKREGVSSTSALATILIERVFDGLALLFLVAIVSLFIPVAGLFRELGEQANVNWLVLTLGLSVPFFLTTAAIIALAVWPERVEGLVASVMRVLPRRVRGTALRFSIQFMVGLSVLRSPRRTVALFLLSVPVWLGEAAMYFVIALGFGLHDSFPGLGMLAGVLVLTTATSNLGTSILSTGGGIGPFEFFAQATLIFFGVSSAPASAYTLVLHAALLAPVTAIGLAHIWASDLSLGQLVRASQRRGEPEPSPLTREVAP